MPRSTLGGRGVAVVGPVPRGRAAAPTRPGGSSAALRPWTAPAGRRALAVAAAARERLLRVAIAGRRASRVRRRPARIPQRRPRACRRPGDRAHCRRRAAAGRSRHRHLHDGPASCAIGSARHGCTTRSCWTAAITRSRAGPFTGARAPTRDSWSTRTEREFDFAVGTHDGYRPHAAHARGRSALHGVGWLVVDRDRHEPVTRRRKPGGTSIRLARHDSPLARSSSSTDRDAGSRLRRRRRDVSLVAGSTLAVCAPGVWPASNRRPRWCAHRPEAAPFVIATFIPAAVAGDEPVTIVEIAAARHRRSSTRRPGRESVFAVRSGGEDLHLSVAFPARRSKLSRPSTGLSRASRGSRLTRTRLDMCGIAGFADSAFGGRPGQTPRRLDAEFNLVHRMCEVIRHRGPDDEGIHVEPGLGLGMRRLSIIDLAGGRQPIHNEDEDGLGGLQRRDLQLPRAARGARGARAPLLHVQRHRNDRPRLRSSGARTRSAGCAGCSASRSGTGRSARCSSRATAPARSRCTTRSAAGGSTSAARSSRCSPPARSSRRSTSRRSITTWRFSTRRATRRSSKACGSCRRAISCAGATAAPRSSSYWQVGAPRPSRGSEAEADRGAGRGAPGRGRLAHGQRRAARRVPLRRRRLVSRRRHDGARVVAAGQDVLDRLRRPGIRRAGTRADGRAAFRHRSPRVRRPARRPVDPRRPGRALRRAVRRFLGDPDLVRLGDRAAARHGRAVGRRRRRAVRRLRPLPAASPRRAVRPPAAARVCATAASLAVAAAAARRAKGKNFLRHVAQGPGRPLPRFDRDVPGGRARGALRAGRRGRARRRTPRRRSRATSSGSPRCRTTAG